ncbi:type VI secretion system-associated FHA domain protein TagH [Marinomonas posidonica]|uniref:FHA domain containing protein n=1 Tax=Marinomonas posidonica (strain CECT 7376 / NCIMB 14433 / IVIA-Po-181) TaxID=491952 RepID=F6CWV9_MARPP|nr:type VI secretion system-associated FHA domain protein TagH [Marinomonas posidonica]AEF55521.1 FHA domain containing protein [Marinomonas posidonica IVIA-Po-181]
MDDVPRVLNLIVVNVSSLEVGLLAKSTFTETGGMIGSNTNIDWYLIDKSKSIAPIHCEIVYIDNAFCLKDISGKTYVNYSEMPLGYGNLARLSDGDVIKIGDYELRVFVNRDADLKNSDYSLDQLFPSQDSKLLEDNDYSEDDADLEIDDAELLEDEEQDKSKPLLDPLAALDDEIVVVKTHSLFEDEEEDVEPDLLLDVINRIPSDVKLGFTMQADGEDDVSSAIKFSKNKTTRKTENVNFISDFENKDLEKMDNKILDYLDNEVGIDLQEKDDLDSKLFDSRDELFEKELERVNPVSNNHVLGGPIIDGLGVDIGKNLSLGEMQSLSSEVATTLKSCVQGLLDLNAQVKNSRYGLIQRSLQPIEDNPLNLGLSYEETIRVMFDEDKSLMHLSAASSVQESMEMIKVHNEAVQHAITSALSQILQSLSPEILIKRFKRYARNNTHHHSEEGAWAWDMYERYYSELTSNRQQGFDKLFWEIFEQSYDRKVREKHAEQ